MLATDVNFSAANGRFESDPIHLAGKDARFQVDHVGDITVQRSLDGKDWIDFRTEQFNGKAILALTGCQRGEYIKFFSATKPIKAVGLW